MIALDTHPDGVILPVKAQPSGRSNAIRGTHAGALRVSVTAPPEDGKANDAIIVLLADLLNLRRSQFRFLAGETSRLKRLLIAGITAEDLLNRIDAILEPTQYDPSEPDPQS